MKRLRLRAIFALTCLAVAAPAAAALDVASLDRSADACTDFYRFANGKWLQSTTLPDNRARYGVFQMLEEQNEKILVDAFREALAKPLPPAGSAERMALQYFASGMELQAIERAGLKPLQPAFARLASMKSARDMPAALAYLHMHGLGGGFALDIDADAKRSTHYLTQVRQGGLGLPDRDYYFRDDERTHGQREAYRKHVARMFELAGDTPQAASKHSEVAIAIEKDLAAASMTAVERRDPEKTYNKMTVAQLDAMAPGFDWRGYLNALGGQHIAELDVKQVEFAKAFARMAGERPIDDWRTYYRWHVLRTASDKLPAAFDEQNFDFYERQLKGVKTPPPRERRVILTIGGGFGGEGLGMAVGKIYVDKAFPPEAKARAMELIRNVKSSLEDRLRSVDWMSEETRRRSIEKAASMRIKIGYPDQWRDYRGADVGPYSYVENWMRATAFDMKRDIGRSGKAVDRGEWLMGPHIVNAYYNAGGNEIVFPAAILRPPYFDMNADDASNYGGIGMVIGHEITHGFDDRGRLYDKDGNMRDWWTPEDARRYKERAQRVVDQYSGMEGVDGVKPNGALTLGENLSDVGGLKISFYALQKALKQRPQGPIDGLTPEQRFFVSFAHGWRNIARTEYERNALLTGQHSLPRFRVMGPIRHMPEFAQAFSCDASKALLAEGERANIW